MERKNQNLIPPSEHVDNIFKEYTLPSRVLRSFTNLSNTVIQTALSGQNKFLFEILQNADDAYEDDTTAIEVELILDSGYLIVHHNGKGFDYNDVERLCDYASQIEEIKANDLSKTGYKGLGFKSLFNLSECIYIYSNGYSFRFDKSYWREPQNRPWQIIPIWCQHQELPLNEKHVHNQAVNFILKINNAEELKRQLEELVNQPELLLFLRRVNKVNVIINGNQYLIERKTENFAKFTKADFYINQQVKTSWLLRLYNVSVPYQVQNVISKASRFIYPEKIKFAKEVPFTFAVRIDSMAKEVSIVQGLCYGTLPTQLRLNLPYHVNGYFILNLDRTQLHENEWNSFLMSIIGYLQMLLLEDIAQMPNLRNYVINLFVREISHSYYVFREAFLKGFEKSKNKVAWLPSQKGHYLKLGEAWIDEIHFFKQNFSNVQNPVICPCIINYDVKNQTNLSNSEAKRFTFKKMLNDFSTMYFQQLTFEGYINFINYLYEKLIAPPTELFYILKQTPFLIAKNGILIPPEGAWIINRDNPFPDFFNVNPIDDKFLPSNKIVSIKKWLIKLGANQFNSPADIIRESLLSDRIEINRENHLEIMNYLAKNYGFLTNADTYKLKQKLVILTKSNRFMLARSCYLPDAVPIKELNSILSDNEQISSTYNMSVLKEFFTCVGVTDKLHPVEVLRRSILEWIRRNVINIKITIENFSAIIGYIADNYNLIADQLSKSEKEDLKKIPILTCDQKFQRAQMCYFDFAANSLVKGLKGAITKNELVSSKNLSENVYKFLLAIGVSKEIKPEQVLKQTVLSWIDRGVSLEHITIDNHKAILEYIAKWYGTFDLSFSEEKKLRKIPVLTKDNTFNEACKCYSSFLDNSKQEIPNIESIILPNELASSDYSKNITYLLKYHLGVQSLKFDTVCKKYSNYLNKVENLKWFFLQLTKYCSGLYRKDNDDLLIFLQKKFHSRRSLLGKDNKMYLSSELYSFQFKNVNKIDPSLIPLLNYDKLPEDIEKWLGVKRELDLECIKKLLEVIRRKPLHGEETRKFFTMLLNQLRQKNENEVKSSQLSLLSKKNELKFAKDLYYFIEEDADCIYESCYLKRIHGMTHKDTLELAQLCGVNIVPFEKTVKFGNENPAIDNSLKKYYLERLPLIVLIESKKLNDDCSVILKCLYDKISSIELRLSTTIHVCYTFGSCITKSDYDGLKLYVTKKWRKDRSNIFLHLNKTLGIVSNINSIMDIEDVDEDSVKEWLDENDEDLAKFYSVHKMLQQLQTTGEISDKNEKNDVFNSNQEANYLENNAFSKLQEDISRDSMSEEDFSEAVVNNESCQMSNKIPKIEKDSKYRKSDESVYVATSEDEDVEINSKYSVVAEPDDENDVKKHALSNELKSLSLTEWSTSSEAVSHETTKAVLVEEGLFSNLQVDVEKFLLKRFEGKYESRFQQGQYRRKYPNSTRNLSEGKFTSLCHDLPKIEIIWINEIDERDYPYNVLLKEYKPSDELESVGSSKYENVDINATRPSTAELDINNDVKKYPLNNELQSLGTRNWNAARDSHATTTAVLVRKRFSTIMQDDSEMHVLKRIGEKNLFTFEPKLYRNKYSHSTLNLSKRHFTLYHDLPKMKIIWVNETEDRGYLYDLLLKTYRKSFDESEYVAVSEDEGIVEINTKWPVATETNTENDASKCLIVNEFYSLDSKNLHSSKEAVSHAKITAVVAHKRSFSIFKEGNKKPVFKKLGEKNLFTFSQEPYRGRRHDSTLKLSRGKFKLLFSTSDRAESIAISEDEDVEMNTKEPAITETDIENDVSIYLSSYKLESFGTKNWLTARESVSCATSKAMLLPKGFANILQDNSGENFLKRLGVEYAFRYLQEHYKRKYPNSTLDESEGKFTLLFCDLPKIEIIWVNKTVEKDYPYDLVLKKDGEVKRVIGIELINVEDTGSFYMNHSEYIEKISQLAILFPQYKEKYCHFHILNIENLLTSTGKKNFPPALYKVMLLKHA